MRSSSLIPLALLLAGCGALDIGLPQEPVTSITIAGPARAKVGDSHQLAAQIAASDRFRFSFAEAQGSVHELDFRVSGLAERLPPLLAGCPVGG